MGSPRSPRRLIYGPVPSRRLGASLGVDLVPPKTCDYDCIYCQLGRTPETTTGIAPYVGADAVLSELESRLRSGPRPDYVTLAGSGEPTLNSELGKIVSGIKELTDVPVAVLTNGSLLGDERVAGACLDAELVLPSLDAGDEETFRQVNRPCAGLALDEVVEGLVEFRREYRGTMWLEVMLLDGINSGDESVRRIGGIVERIGPDEVHLNTVVRPPAERYAKAVSEQRLGEIASILRPHVTVLRETMRSYEAPAVDLVEEDELLELISRRPSTRSQVAAAFGINEIEALKVLSRLVDSHGLVSEFVDGEVFYRLP